MLIEYFRIRLRFTIFKSLNQTNIPHELVSRNFTLISFSRLLIRSSRSVSNRRISRVSFSKSRLRFKHCSVHSFLQIFRKQRFFSMKKKLKKKSETNLAGVRLSLVRASCKLFVTVFSVLICDSRRCLFCRSSFRFRSRSVRRCLSRCRCVLIESYLINNELFCFVFLSQSANKLGF